MTAADPGSPVAAALLAEVWRGEVPEVAVRGHVAVVDAGGRLLATQGDPDALTTLRSAVKPLQALPFCEPGVAGALGVSEEEVALACGSHDGGPEHVAVARRLLERVGLDDRALSCAAHWPYGEAAARALAAAGQAPGPIHNNCSGKHAAMLAVCVQEGLPVDGYAAAGHPLQRRIAATMGELMGRDLAAGPGGVDGCGLPTYGVPLRALARGFAAAQRDRAGFRRCQAAMAAHPRMVGGAERFDTALLAGAGQRVTAKSGGAAVWAAVDREQGVAAAVKLEAGIGPQMPAVAIAVLQAMSMLPDPMPATLDDHAAGRLRNWAGDPVGATRVVVRLAGVHA